MKRSLIPMAGLALFLTAASAQAVGVIPPANKWASSLTEPTPLTGSDFHITKPSSATVSVTAGNVTFLLKMSGVLDANNANLPANQTLNVFQVTLRYGGVVHTESFNFSLVNGKTVTNATKFTVANGSLGGAGVVSDDSIQIVDVKCFQGGAGPGAPNNFCTPGLTAK